ncbi:hypothetical protein AURDEDRAFT_168854 [Auricularia subglabra TFB-10046 SS5]|nr:hypothetical protein AURDEDRAFT_168854 [Auricularia subglabra TFB-10046 SS5]
MSTPANDLDYRLFMIQNVFQYADKYGQSQDRLALARKIYLQGSGETAPEVMDDTTAKQFGDGMMQLRMATNLDVISDWQRAFRAEEKPVPRSIAFESLANDAEFDAVTSPILASLSVQLELFLRKENPLPLWDPPAVWDQVMIPGTGLSLRSHLRQLGLPVNPLHPEESSTPDFLLYRLGLYRTVDGGTLSGRTTNLLSGQSHRVVMNTSGSGKSRLLFETLCLTWGLYLTFASDLVTNPYGSEDLARCLDQDFLESVLNSDGAFLPTAWGLAGSSKVKFAAQLKHNQTVVEHVMQAVVLARLLVLRIFLVIAESIGLTKRDQRRAWLLLQLFPRLTDAGELTGVVDFFLELTLICARLSQTALTEQLRVVAAALPSEKYPRVVVLDEVQNISSKWWNAFSDQSHTQHRSLLRPVVIGLQKGMRVGRFMIAGTRLYYNDVLNALSSNVFKHKNFTEFTDLGGFVDWSSEMRSFLGHVLTAAFVDSWPSDLTHNVRFWFTGRHRFLVFLLQQILMQGPNFNSIRNVIDNIVFSASGEHLPEYVAGYTPIARVQIKGLVPSAFLQGKERASIRRARQSVLQFLTQMTVPRYDLKDTQLVDLGIGRFVVDKSEKTLRIEINERLVLTALRAFFDSPGHRMGIRAAINDVLHNVSGSDTVAGLGFEDAMVYLLWRRFSGDGAVLSDVFDFEPDVRPLWADKRARLIAAFHPGSREAKDFVLRGLTAVLARNCSKIEESLDWFVNQCGIPFLKPDNFFGPDIIFALQLYDPEAEEGAGQQTIYVCVQCKNWSKDRGGFSVRKAIFCASPEGFYRSNSAHKEIILKYLKRFTPLPGTLLDGDEVRSRVGGFTEPPDPGSAGGAPKRRRARKAASTAAKGQENLVIKYDNKVEFAILRCLAVFPDVAKIDRPVSRNDGIYPLAYISKNIFQEGCSVGFDLFKSALERAGIAYAAQTEEERQEMQNIAPNEDEEIPSYDPDEELHENAKRDWAAAQAPDSGVPTGLETEDAPLEDESEDELAPASPVKGRNNPGKAKARGKGKGKASSKAPADDDESGGWMDTEDDEPQPTPPPPQKSPSKGKGKAKAKAPEDDETVDMQLDEAPAPATKAKRAAKRPRTNSMVSANPRTKRKR